jgi:hypothetical protein
MAANGRRRKGDLMTSTATQRKAWEIRMPWKEWSAYADTPLWGKAAARLSGSNGI